MHAYVNCFRYPGLKPPMVGGCDLVGEVVEDRSGSLAPGDKVVFNGWGVGTDHYGGYAGMASLRHACKQRLEWVNKFSFKKLRILSMLAF